MFTWIPIYRELAESLVEYRDRQNELLDMVDGLKVQGLSPIRTEDKDKQNRPIPLTEIDPFTFFANFNRGSFNKDTRRKIVQFFTEKFQLASQLPEDFEGIPVVSPLAAWFFSYASERKTDDIRTLWDLAKAVLSKPPQELDAKLFERCLRIKNVGPAKLTMGMFWLNPRDYIALDENNRQLFRENSIDCKVRDLSAYIDLIHSVNEKLGENYPEISQEAWQHANETVVDKNYWAGGHQLGEVNKLKEFTEGNFWQIGWDKNSAHRTAKKTWKYFDQIKPGDEFAIKGYGGKNHLNIHYLGEVVAKVEPGTLRLKKLDRTLYKGEAPKGPNWFVTLVPVTQQPAIDAIFHGAKPLAEGINELNETTSEPRASNLILYGPPGTGKTYQTIRRSVELIDHAFSGDHTSYKRKFDDLVRDKRIEFITFHQSFSYEDFVEGIRPVLDRNGGSPRYECRAGIFKQLAVNALFDCLRTDSVKAADGVYTDIQKGEIVQRFLADLDPNQLKPKSQWKPYVLIIDEVNRGISKILGELITLIEPDKRVGKDHQNTLVVTLPYSGDRFAVPSNLFLLATMNSADKSIALVDLALRRRFDFEELRVDFEICKMLSEKMRRALVELNRRITLRKDRDHQIGHAYFVAVEDEKSFDHIFRKRIIPLLQEYFYNDWDGLRYVLGEEFPEKTLFILKIAEAKDGNIRNKWQWFFDAGTNNFNCLQTLCSNYDFA